MSTYSDRSWLLHPLPLPFPHQMRAACRSGHLDRGRHLVWLAESICVVLAHAGTRLS